MTGLFVVVFLRSLTSPLLNLLPGPVKCTCLYLCMNVHMSLLSLNKIWIWMHYHLRLLIAVLVMWYISVFPLKWVMRSELFLVIKSHFASCSRSVFLQGKIFFFLQNANIRRTLFIFSGRVLVCASATSCWFSVHVEKFAFIFGLFLCLASSDMRVSKNGAGLVTIWVSILISSLAVKNITQQSLISTCLTRLSAQLSPVSIMHAAFGKEFLWQRKYDCVVVSHNTPALWVSCTVSYILLTSYSAYCLLLWINIRIMIVIVLYS